MCASDYLISPPTMQSAYKALGLPTSCGCPICEAGGSCIEPPYPTTIEDLVERLPWANIAAALKAMGLEVVLASEDAGPDLTPYEEAELVKAIEAADAEELAEYMTLVANGGLEDDFAPDEEEVTVGDLLADCREAAADLRAAGASRHQLRRLHKKLWDTLVQAGIEPEFNAENALRLDAEVDEAVQERFYERLTNEVAALRDRIEKREERAKEAAVVEYKLDEAALEGIEVKNMKITEADGSRTYEGSPEELAKFMKLRQRKIEAGELRPV